MGAIFINIQYKEHKYMTSSNQKGGGLLRYVQEQLSKKKSKEDIIKELREMGWPDSKIDNCFLEVERKEKLKRRNIVIGLCAAALIIIAFVFILLFSPRSPLKYKRTMTISPEGSAQEEDIFRKVYDITKDENISSQMRERIEKARKEREEEIKTYDPTYILQNPNSTQAT